VIVAVGCSVVFGVLIMALSFEAFIDTFGDARYKKIRNRGYIAYRDKHVLSFNLDPDNGVMFGRVMPSQRSGEYNVKVSINLLKKCEMSNLKCVHYS